MPPPKAPATNAIDRGIDAAFLFVGRLLRTAYVLAFRPRRAAKLIREQTEGLNTTLAGDAAFLLITSLLAGIRLRVAPTLVGELSLKHFYVAAREVRNASISGAILTALPLVAGSTMVARGLAVAATRSQRDRRHIEALSRYVLGESYLLTLLIGAIPGLFAGLLSFAPEPDVSSWPVPGFRAQVGISLALGLVIGLYLLCYYLVPLALPTLSARYGSRGLGSASRRWRFGFALVPCGLLVAMFLVPSAASAVYSSAKEWWQDAPRPLALAVRASPATLTDYETPCSGCPKVKIPVVLVNGGTAHASVGHGMVQIKGAPFASALRGISRYLYCDHFVFGGTIAFDGDQSPMNEVLKPGDVRAAYVEAHVPISVLHRVACDRRITMRAAVFVSGVGFDSAGDDLAEAGSPWQPISVLCDKGRALPLNVVTGSPPQEDLMPPLQTLLEGLFVVGQCRLRLIGIFEKSNPDDLWWLFTDKHQEGWTH